MLHENALSVLTPPKNLAGGLFYFTLTASFSALPARKPGTLPAGMVNSLPVCGLRPVRAARSRTENVPKPTSATSSPSFSESETELTNASNTRPAAALEISASAAILSINCDLFTLFIPSFIIHFARRILPGANAQQVISSLRYRNNGNHLIRRFNSNLR